jgi:hypothetical protein
MGGGRIVQSSHSQVLASGKMLVWLALLMLALPFVHGCGSSSQVVNPQEDKSAQNLQQIGAAYTQAAGKLGRPPQQASDLHELIKNGPGNPDPESILRSPDDNEPYVIVWGIDFGQLARATGNPSDIVIAYEKRGKNGKRHVLKPPSIVLTMTDEAFRAAKFPPGHTPEP